MQLIDSVILGIIQGITEFLPISSTGHLVLAREFFGWSTQNALAYDAVLQFATSLAVLIYFRKDFLRLLLDLRDFILRKTGDYRLMWAIILGTIPAVIIGLSLEDLAETAFRAPLSVAIALILGSMLFFLAEKIGTQRESITSKKGLVIGLFQALAIIPGMSRSGATLSGGLFAGLTRTDAARFSFILSFPIVFGAGLYKLRELFSTGAIESLGSSLLIGSIFAFTFGMLSIHYLLKYLKNHTLGVFIIYRIALAAVILFFVF